MRVISMFFKNWRKKRLRQKIANLKIEAASLKYDSEFSKQTADEATTILKKRSAISSTKDFKKISNIVDTSNKHSAIFQQMYLDTLDEIKCLEKELQSL